MSATDKQLDFFERYRTLWVGFCMVLGLLLGKTAPGLVDGTYRYDPEEPS